jgi:hypothetical protein
MIIGPCFGITIVCISLGVFISTIKKCSQWSIFLINRNYRFAQYSNQMLCQPHKLIEYDAIGGFVE